ncbi:MAG TPA: glutamine-hydrolyzing carbamoyl-phosphate synthase small subunit [Thermoanaerobaculia bacterium]|nr:glutamine-hydrolyzing carbamoyl-phosphate synthase small subunit [Thermoanaerobaculia bacterium]
MKGRAILLLEDGRRWEGRAVGARGTAFGEVVFNTGMAGYQETLTDPSYNGQIVVMTASHIGNYGLNDEDVESGKIQVAGFAARLFSDRFSNARGKESVADALSRASVPGIDGLDTRALVRHLRSAGAMRGALSSEVASDADEAALLERVRTQPGMAGAALALSVSTPRAYGFPLPPGVAAKGRVAAIDYGIKTNILRMLAARGLAPTVFPATTPAAEVLAQGFDGIFLSNGPGDPDALPGPVANVKAFVESGRPVFGICLGQQLLGLAVGGTTYKLKFGHRGANHPVRNVQTGHVAITSQNHGFSVAADSLPKNAELTHVNLNDGTCEGFRLTDRPVFAVQYHPESSPGPHDSDALFDEFVGLVTHAPR